MGVTPPASIAAAVNDTWAAGIGCPNPTWEVAFPAEPDRETVLFQHANLRVRNQWAVL